MLLIFSRSMTLAPPSAAVKAATIPVEPEPITTISVFVVFAALLSITHLHYVEIKFLG
jgi:hypothetical protein